MSKAHELTGQVFGRLTAIERAANYVTPKGSSETQWQCQCSCGSVVIVLRGSLVSKRTQSCGCLKKETAIQNRAFVCPCSNAKLREIYESGTPVTAIAEMYGVAQKTVAKWLDVAGVIRRSKSQTQRLTCRKCRINNLANIRKAGLKHATLIKQGVLCNSHLHTPENLRRRVLSFNKTNAARRAKQQAEQEQSEIIEHALNGTTFR